jgi:mono/diheme cytochrome c family protein
MKSLREKLVVAVSVPAVTIVAVLCLAALKYRRHESARYATIPAIDLTEEMKTADRSLGERIVRVRNACSQCHGEDLGGKVFVDGPPGRFVGPNLTPYALSSWSDGEIARAIHYGVGREHQALLIMPSDNFQHLSKQDVASVIAYLRSVPPVARPNQKSKVRLVGKILFLLGKIPALFPVDRVDAPSPFEEKPQEAPSLAFGKYMVKTSCMGCHGENLAGGRIPGGPPDWPAAADLRPSAIGGWGEQAFIETLRTGLNPSGRKLRLPMPVEMTRQMNDIELKAIWLYLRSI